MPAMGAPVTIVGGTGGSAANPSFEQSVGSNTIATSQASSSISPAAATLIVAARAGRRSVTLSNITGTQPAYFGNSGVLVGTGFFLAGTAGASVTIPTTTAIYATSPTAAQTISVMENY